MSKPAVPLQFANCIDLSDNIYFYEKINKMESIKFILESVFLACEGYPLLSSVYLLVCEGGRGEFIGETPHNPLFCEALRLDSDLQGDM